MNDPNPLETHRAILLEAYRKARLHGLANEEIFLWCDRDAGIALHYDRAGLRWQGRRLGGATLKIAKEFLAMLTEVGFVNVVFVNQNDAGGGEVQIDYAFCTAEPPGQLGGVN